MRRVFRSARFKMVATIFSEVPAAQRLPLVYRLSKLRRIVIKTARHCDRAGFPHIDCSLSHLRLTCIKFAPPQTRIVGVLNIRTKPRMR